MTNAENRPLLSVWRCPETVEDKFRTRHPHLKDFYPWLSLLNKESARGAVLISTGFMEQQLKEVLRAFLIDNSGMTALFDGGFAPLGSFSARIAACHALGLISDDEQHDLTLIRKIRNDFAHEIHTDFSTAGVMDRCKALKAAAKDYTKPDGEKVAVDTRGQFMTAATAIVLGLVNRPHYVGKQRRTHQPWNY